MNWYDKAFVCGCLIAFIGAQASYQAVLFKNNKTISHFWKGMLYVLFIAVFAVLYSLSFNSWWYLLIIGAYGVSARAAFFDPLLNWARDKPLFYNQTTLRSNIKGSLLDRLENKLSVPYVKALKILYVIIFVLVVIYLK